MRDYSHKVTTEQLILLKEAQYRIIEAVCLPGGLENKAVEQLLTDITAIITQNTSF